MNDSVVKTYNCRIYNCRHSLYLIPCILNTLYQESRESPKQGDRSGNEMNGK